MIKKQEKLNSERPLCPDCHIKMGKTGMCWSGRRRVQRYKCSRCGKVIADTSKKS